MAEALHVRFLGTGSVHAAPVPGCSCHACARVPASARRKPASADIRCGETRLLLDAGRHDLMDRYPAGALAAILLTHFHPDHVLGLFPWRWAQLPPLPVYAPQDAVGCADLLTHPGWLRFAYPTPAQTFPLGGLDLTPVPLAHSRPTFGWCIAAGEARFAYLTDTCGLPPGTLRWLQAWRPTAVAIDCSFPPGEGGNHNDLPRALALLAQLQPQQGWLTHLGHGVEAYLAAQPQLPPGVALAAEDTDCVIPACP